MKLGDIVEIKTFDGFAYAQYPNRHAMHGQLIRLLPDIHAKRPDDLAALTMTGVRFAIFFPVDPAVTRGYVAIASEGSSRNTPSHFYSSKPESRQTCALGR
jgi:hypothetical protein